MGFYHGTSQPPDEEPPGSWREALAITWAVFRVLALPVGVLVGAVFFLVLLFYLFTVHALLGLGAILLLVLGLVARGVWEAKHPPDLG